MDHSEPASRSIAGRTTPPPSHPGRRYRPPLAVVVALCSVAGVAAVPDRADAIVGGSAASEGAYPFMVSLRENGYPYCGGTLIAAQWVLTAAHCANGHAPDALDAVVDQAQLSGSGGEARDVDRVILDPSYDAATQDFDVALLHLAIPTSDIQPVTLIESDDQYSDAAGRIATVIGYGSTAPQSVDGRGDIAYPGTLQQTQVPIVSDEHCTSVFNGHDEPAIRPDLMMCAGGDGRRDACVGDSGGPLLVPGVLPGTWTDVGVTSWGAGCAVAGVPGVYTRLADPPIEAFVKGTIDGS